MARDQRIGLAAKLIAQVGSTIVFCRTKRGADRVARQLETAGVRAAAIHGDRSQGQRERALAAFQAGQVDALVATDVAARGIHVDDVAAVIHLDPPADEKDYIHRSGRTGRAGATGVVVSFVAPELRRDVAKMQRTLGLPVGLTDPDVGRRCPSWPSRRTAARRRPAPPRARERAERPDPPSRAGRPPGSPAPPSGSFQPGRAGQGRTSPESKSTRARAKPRPSRPLGQVGPVAGRGQGQLGPGRQPQGPSGPPAARSLGRRRPGPDRAPRSSRRRQGQAAPAVGHSYPLSRRVP